jgi:hypothetical protein
LLPHALAYFVLFVLYILVNLLFNVLTLICSQLCCFKDSSVNLEVTTNIYEELSVEDLRTEYAKTRQELKDVQVHYNNVFADDLRNLLAFAARLELKLKYLRTFVQGKLLEMGLNNTEGDGSMDIIDMLFQVKKNDATHKIRSLYSYDIKDNNEFKKA